MGPWGRVGELLEGFVGHSATLTPCALVGGHPEEAGSAVWRYPSWSCSLDHGQRFSWPWGGGRKPPGAGAAVGRALAGGIRTLFLAVAAPSKEQIRALVRERWSCRACFWPCTLREHPTKGCFGPCGSQGAAQGEFVPVCELSPWLPFLLVALLLLNGSRGKAPAAGKGRKGKITSRGLRGAASREPGPQPPVSST